MATFGIHFGNTNCCIAVHNENKLNVIVNPDGYRVTPTLVTYTTNGAELGSDAKGRLLSNSRSTLGGIVRCLGAKTKDEIAFPYGLKCQITVEKKKLKYAINCEEFQKVIPQEDVIRKVFTCLKGMAGNHSTEGKLPSVISVPPWIFESSYPIIAECATSIGFKVLNIITQPSASCSAYELLENNALSCNVLLFHCGGTSVVASVGEIRAGMFSLKDTSGPISTAGDAITEILVERLAKEFYQKYKLDPLENRRSRMKLFDAAAKCKQVLSIQGTAAVHIDSLCEGIDMSTSVARGRFLSWIQPTLNEIVAPINEVLERCNYTTDQIDKVILSGGSCNIPKIQQMVASMLSNAEILNSLAPEEVTAMGAARESSFHIGQKLPKYTTNPVMTLLKVPLYANIGTEEGQLVFASGSPSQCRKTLSHTSLGAPFNVVLYESEKKVGEPSEDQIVAIIEIADAPKDDTIQFEFLIRRDCSIEVKLKGASLRNRKTYVIESERAA